jgi:hypothetical protein
MAMITRRMLDEYKAACSERQEIISRNRSNRLRGLPLIQVPPKPAPIYGYAVYVGRDWQYFIPETDRDEADRFASEDREVTGYTLKRTVCTW